MHDRCGPTDVHADVHKGGGGEQEWSSLYPEVGGGRGRTQGIWLQMER